MNLNAALNERNISQYKLALLSHVPQTTISDICLNKTSLEKCSGITLYNIASSLDITIEDLLFKQIDTIKPQEFDIFKSSICHMIKSKSPKEFIKEIENSNLVSSFFDNSEYAKSFYLIAMADYLCRLESLPKIEKFEKYRKYSLETNLYPASVIIYSKIMDDKNFLKNALKNSIPEFRRFNIIERDIENVI